MTTSKAPHTPGAQVTATPTAGQVQTPEQEAAKFAIVRRAANLPEGQWLDDRIRAIRATVVPAGASLAQFSVFMATAAKYDLDPLVGEIWLADVQGRMLVLTGRNTFLKIAQRQRDYAGLSAGVVYAKDKFSAHREGDRVVVDHLISGFDRGALVGAWCVVRVTGKPDIYIQREMSKFSHLQGKDNWKKYPDDMIENRAIVAALRRAYNLSGLLEKSEAEDPMIEGPAAVSTGAEKDRALAGTLEGADALRRRLTAARSTASAVVDEPPGMEGVSEALVEESEEGEARLLSAEEQAALDLELDQKLVAEDEPGDARE